MKALAGGIKYGIQQYVIPAIAEIPKYLPDSPAEKGPLSKEPDWSYLSEGMKVEFDAIGGMISSFGAMQPIGQGVASGGVTYYYNLDGAVIQANDADELLDSLNELTERGVAFSRVGSF